MQIPEGMEAQTVFLAAAHILAMDFLKSRTLSPQSRRPHLVKLFIWLLICMLQNEITRW